MKHYTRTLLGNEARAALMKGIDAVYRPVAATIGAKGRNSVYREYGFPKPTNDGVSIARQIMPYDEFEKIGADLLKEAAEQTVTVAGDGTTTSVIVTRTLVDEGNKEIEAGKDPMQLRAELERDRDFIVAKIKDIAIPVASREDIFNVAKISVEDDRMAEIVTDAVQKAGKYGAVIVEEGSGYDIEIEEVSGYHWDRGYMSPYMITNPDTNEAVLEDVPVILAERHMNLNKDLMPTLNELAQNKELAALVVCDKIEGELLQSLIANKIAGKFVAIAVYRPQTLEELEDLAALTGAEAITKDKGIKQITWAHTGRAKRIVIGKEKATIVCESSQALVDRVKTLQEALEKDKKNETLIARIAKLTDGMVMLRVGAKTEAERKYKKDKMDDAVCAAKAATEEGIVEGAGATLYKLSLEVESPVMAKALQAPYHAILKNAGIEPDGNFYDVRTGEKVDDLIKSGIIDPAKVERSVVENAVSLAGTVLTLESVIAHFEEKEPK